MAADSGTVAGEFCANHPDRPTALRCNKCAKLICPGCALHTPVGYRCPQCVRGQQAVFETAHWYDYVTAAVTALVLSGLAGVLLSRLGWLLLFLAPTTGGALAEVVRRVVQRRRGRYLPHTVVAAMVLAALPALSLWMLLYLGLAGAAVFARLRGSLI